MLVSRPLERLGLAGLPSFQEVRLATRVSRVTGEVRRGRITPYSRFVSQYPEYVDQLEILEREFAARCSRLGRLGASRQRDAVRQLLRMRHLFPIFAFSALKRTGAIGSASPDTVQALADEFNPFRPVQNEMARLVHSRSPSRTSRVIDQRCPKDQLCLGISETGGTEALRFLRPQHFDPRRDILWEIAIGNPQLQCSPNCRKKCLAHRSRIERFTQFGPAFQKVLLPTNNVRLGYPGRIIVPKERHKRPHL